MSCDKDYNGGDVLIIILSIKIASFLFNFSFTNVMDGIGRNEGSISSARRIAIQSFCSPQCKYANMVR